jgi:hypothetical protein
VGYDTATYQVNLATPGSLILHQFYFPPWRITVDGAAAPARPAPAGGLGLLAVDLPAGEHTVTVHWSATPAVWVGRVLTAGGWAAVLGLLLAWGRGRRRGWWAAAAWLAAGALLVLAASGVTARTSEPLPIGADFGPVRLEASAVAPAHAGAAASVRLYWTMEGPGEPLAAFVHVVDAAGAVVAQHDGPLAGDYTPHARWQPGLVLAHTHDVALPADLEPGRYGLKAGVYRPGEASSPLLPMGASDPRVDAGVLEVQP